MADTTLISRRAILFAPLVLAACKRDAARLMVSGFTMGTTYSIAALDQSRSVSQQELASAVDKALQNVNAKLSNWDASSEISRFNASATTDALPVSTELFDVVSAAQAVHDASDGQFDITMGPLIELWGFGANRTADRAPSDAQIAATLEAIGQSRQITIANGALQKTRPETELFVSAIGKGYGVDQLAAVMQDFGITDYMVEIGGDLVTSGRNFDGDPWQIGIEAPIAHDREVQQIVSVSGLGMATSGDYRNYFQQDGVRYSHILDAKTGRPITHKTASATVLTENAMLADAWATAMLILGREQGLDVARSQDLAVLFIEQDGNDGFKATPSERFSELQA